MKRTIITLLLLIPLLLSACGKPEATNESPKTSENAAVTFTDAPGHSVTVNSANRVIALSGSFAETWLLAGGDLIGTTQDAFSDGISLPDGVQNVGSLHNPSLEQIIALNPDFLILSANISGHVELYEQLNAAGITTAYFDVEVFSDYLDMLKICTDITGEKDLYETNGLVIQDKLEQTIADASAHASKPPRILLLRANATDATARNSHTMAGAMLKDLGCINIADDESGLLENLSLEAIIQEDPDFIFAVTMGESEEKALAVLDEKFRSNSAWAGLSAVKNKRYFVLPKDLFHQKPNNRWDESYALLYDILYG
jgi:iron complex transport system substrate-binding protein